VYMCVSPVSWMSTSLSSGVIIDNAGGLYSNVMCSLIHQLPVLTLHTTQILNSTHATHNTNTELNSRYTQHKYWTELTLHTTQTLNSTHATHNTNIELNSRYTQHKHWTQLSSSGSWHDEKCRVKNMTTFLIRRLLVMPRTGRTEYQLLLMKASDRGRNFVF